MAMLNNQRVYPNIPSQFWRAMGSLGPHWQVKDSTFLESCGVAVSRMMISRTWKAKVYEVVYHWIGFLGKILTGNPWVFTIKLIGLSCKFSHHPILWV